MRLAIALVAALVGCEKADPPLPKPAEPPTIPGIELPEVLGEGYTPVRIAPRLVVSDRAITLDGKSVVTLRGGNVDGSDLAGTGRDVVIPALVRAAAGTKEPIIAAFDRRLWFGLMDQVIHSLGSREVGATSMVVIARTRTALVGVPVAILGPQEHPVTPVRMTDRDKDDNGHTASVTMTEEEGHAYATALTSAGSDSNVDMSRRRPGADLGRQIDEASRDASKRTPPATRPSPARAPKSPAGAPTSPAGAPTSPAGAPTNTRTPTVRLTIASDVASVGGATSEPGAAPSGFTAFTRLIDDDGFAKLWKSVDTNNGPRGASGSIAIEVQHDVAIEIVARALGGAHARFATVTVTSHGP